MDATINGKPYVNWSTVNVQAGDILEFNLIHNGLRSYLSISGGFKVPHFFSSSSTVVREKTGGINGDLLCKGDIVGYAAKNNCESPFSSSCAPKKFIPDYNSDLTLRFTPSYHFTDFDRPSIETFLAATYTVTNDADRMGYRLAGPPLKRESGDILSIGVPCGAIQVPTAGEPIILLNDRQCTGGYPILGVISLRDIYRIAQRKAGDTIRFQIADTEKLKKEVMEFYEFFNRSKPYWL